jgi:hypothetical protein
MIRRLRDRYRLQPPRKHREGVWRKARRLARVEARGSFASSFFQHGDMLFEAMAPAEALEAVSAPEEKFVTSSAVFYSVSAFAPANG